MTENLAKERYEAWLASVRRVYPTKEELRRREKPIPGWLGLRASDLVESRFTYLYEDEAGLD